MPGAATTSAEYLALPAEDLGGRLGLWTSCALAVSATALIVAVVFTGDARHPGLVALARVAIAGLPVAVGLYARSRRSGDRFGLLLVALGAASAVTVLAESSDDGLYTAGRIAGWLFVALLVHVILAFPTGRLEGRADRALVAAIAVVVAVLYLPRALVATQFEVPSPYTSCTAGCPPNGLSVVAREPGFVDGVMRPAGAILVFVIMLAVAVRLLARLRADTPLGRRIFAPVFATAAAMSALLGVAIALRQVQPTAPSLEVVAWLLALAVPVLAVACLTASFRWRLMAGGALERLTASLFASSDGITLRRAFAEAFGDREFHIAFPAPGGDDRWVNSAGQPTAAPIPGAGRGVVEVTQDGQVVAALVHDAALSNRPELLQASVAIAAAALENTRLVAQAQAATLEVERSRARIAASAERERRRIERDLHDGAQQRLVALRIELELTEALVRRDPETGVARLQQLEGELDEALEEIRSLAHGMYPPLLADRGLAEALPAVIGASAIAVELETHSVARYPPEVESAVYFCVREALQNVLKHARARRVVVWVDGSAAGDLRFSVRDDGAGAPGGAFYPGVGLTNMDDRLAAVGGKLRVRSTPGVGTVVTGHVPVGRPRSPIAPGA